MPAALFPRERPQALSASLDRLGGQAFVNELDLIDQMKESADLKDQIRQLVADTTTVMTSTRAIGGSAAAGSGEGGNEMAMMMQQMQSGYGGDEEEEDDGMGAMQAFFGGSARVPQRHGLPRV